MGKKLPVFETEDELKGYLRSLSDDEIFSLDKKRGAPQESLKKLHLGLAKWHVCLQDEINQRNIPFGVDQKKWKSMTYDEQKEYREQEAKKEAIERGADGQMLLPLEIVESSLRSRTVGTPAAFLRSAIFGMVKRGQRRLYEEEKLASLENMEVIFSGRALDQNDLNAFLAVIHYYSVHNKNGVVRLKLYQVLKYLGLTDAGSTRKVFVAQCERLLKAVVKIQINTNKKPVWIAGSIFSSVARDENTDELLVRPNQELQKLFLGSQLQYIDFDARKKLSGNQLAMWLQGFYTSHEPGEYFYSIARLKELCRSSTKRLSDFRRALIEAMNFWQSCEDELVKWEITDDDRLKVVTRKTVKQLVKKLINNKNK